MITGFTTFPQLTTHRLLLRRLDMNDCADLFLLRTNEEVNRYLERPIPASIEEIRAYIKKIDDLLANNKGAYWAISLKNHKVIIGAVCLWNFSLENDTAEIGYELSPAHQGKGIMQEAITKVVEFGFGEMPLKVITAFPKAENEKSVQILKKNNFEQDWDYRYASKEEVGDNTVYFLNINTYIKFEKI
jgi:ribosomal-protein-alanine N-acetyltransferase